MDPNYHLLMIILNTLTINGLKYLLNVLKNLFISEHGNLKILELSSTDTSNNIALMSFILLLKLTNSASLSNILSFSVISFITL